MSNKDMKGIVSAILWGILFFVFSVLIAFVTFAVLQKSNITSEYSSIIIGVIEGAVGSITGGFLIPQIKGSREAAVCDNIANLNFEFINNKRLMNVYQELSKAAEDDNYQIKIVESGEGIVSSDLMGYMTFYEVINEYVKQRIMTIKQMDNMFGDRFFKLIHNDYVQQHELFAEPSSYVNIFELYEKWSKYRKTHYGTVGYVVMNKNRIPDLYISEKLYLREDRRLAIENESMVSLKKNSGISKDFRVCRIWPKSIDQCLMLQSKIIKTLKKENHEAYLEPSSENDMYESMLLDYCYGVFEGDTMVAFCICVLNRDTKKGHLQQRNLCCHLSDSDNYSDYITFDTIQVLPEYRGFGIQNYFLKEAERVASLCNANNIVATVYPENEHSKRNFLKCGYELYKNADMEIFNIYKSKRNIMIKKLKQGESL